MRLLLLAAALLTPALSLHAQADFSLDWWTVDAGGGTSSDDVFTVSGTIGQPDAGVMSDGYFTVAGGFWPSPSTAVSGPTIRTWNGLANGDWFNATNWSPPGAPGPYDSIVFSGGTIALTSTVTIHGQFNWSGGTVRGGALSIASDGVLNIGGGAVSLAGALTNAGTVNWTGGTVAVCCAGPIVNLAGALWDIQCDQTLSPACCVSSNFQFQNAGTVRKSAGSGTTYLQIPFYNAGTVIALQGTLDFQSGGTVDGGYNALAGAAIKFVGGDFVAGAVPVLNGPGPIQLTGGTLTLPSGVVPNLPLAGGTLVLGPNFQGGTITNLTLVGAALSGTNTVSGTLDWQAGTVSGSLMVAKGGVLNLGGNHVSLSGTLTNAGTVNWTNGTLAVCCAGPIVNLAGALWDIQCDQTLSPACCPSPSFQFQNAGTVRKSAGSGATYLQIPFYNAGTVIALQGTLGFQSGGTVDGSYQALAGAAIQFISGDFVSGAAPVLSGPGPLQLSGGTLTLPIGVVPNLQLAGGTLVLGPNFQGGTITNLTLSGATLSGANTVSGTLDWQAGTVSGPLMVAKGGVLNLDGGGVNLSSSLTNAGTVNWTSGGLEVCCAGPVVNLAGALWDIQCDQTLSPACCPSPNFQFQNAGTVRKSAGSGTTYLQIPFYNTGTLSLLSGSVSFSPANAYAQTGATLDFGLSGTGRAAPLLVSGNLGLDGALSASLLNNYAPKPGDTILLISCGALTNSFDYLDLPVAGNNLGWRIVYAANEVSLQVVSNGNTTVQIAGTVTDTSGAPVANLTVFAFTTNSSNSLFLSAATDGSGHYGLSVVNGLWRVGLEGLAARGYNDVPTQDVMVNDAGQTLNFVLLVQPVTRPALRCTLAGSQLLFSWPASLSGVELRITGNLADPNSWRAVPVVPVQAGAEMQVTAPLVPGNHFYRLFRP